jgi:predicted metal-binding membrane protein
MAGASTLEALLRRDRRVVIAALVVVIAASWAYLLAGAGMGMSALEMTAMTPPGDGADAPAQGTVSGDGLGGMAMAMTPTVWTPGYALLMVSMWWVMMVAMMLPSAAPMVLLFALFNRRQREKGAAHVATSAFAWGYVLVWGGFSSMATALQWGLERTGVLSSMMASTSIVLGAVLLIAAGLYQLTPLKQACLHHCRSPIAFISQRWRPGASGALRMGVEHGAFCVGCCWFLMGLLFYGGVMNLYWIIGLALFVLLEKTIPAGPWVGRITGGALIVWGSLLLLGNV